MCGGTVQRNYHTSHPPLARSLGGAEHRLQLARRRLGLGVVVAPDVPASHEDVRHRPLPSHLEERRLDRRAILVLVELDGAHLLCAELGEECLDLGKGKGWG
eukprot:scaffold81050_cov57-Phaeocystis_antarctica.AAC.1